MDYDVLLPTIIMNKINMFQKFILLIVIFYFIPLSSATSTENFSSGSMLSWTLGGSGSWSAMSYFASGTHSGTGTPGLNTATKIIGTGNQYFEVNMSYSTPSGTFYGGQCYCDLFVFGANATSNYAYLYFDTRADQIKGSGFSYSAVGVSPNTWYHIKISIAGGNIQVSVYNAGETTLLNDQTVAYSYNQNTFDRIALIQQNYQISYSSTVYGYYDDIKAYSENPGSGVVTPPATVTVNMVANISYILSLSDFSTYNYGIDVYDSAGQITTTSISTASGSISYPTIGKLGGTYSVYLTSTNKATGVKYYLSYATMFVDSSVSFKGYTRNAITGAIIANTNVNFTQSGTWYNTTSDGSGYYTLSHMVTLYPILVNASKTGYKHFAYSYTPTYAYNYSLDLYLWDNSAHGGTTGIEGIVFKSPFRQALSGATVTAWNATNTYPFTSDANGYWSQTLADSPDSFNVNASKSGYSSASTTASISSLAWTQVLLTLDPTYHLTIIAKDSVTGGYLSTFTVNINDANSTTTTTTTGSISFTEPQGLYLITASAPNYYGSSVYLLLTADTNQVITLTPYTTGTTNISIPGLGGFGTQRYLHYVQFIPQRLNGTRYQGILANFTATDTNGTILSGSGTTGSDGTVGFEMTQNLSYYITFTNASLGVNTAITIYPVSDLYTVCIDTNCTIAFTTGTVNATLTNYTIKYTNKSWSIQNLTSTNITSQIGLGMTGQGILTGITLWFVVGAGGAVTGIAAGVILALMGLITWVMLLFIVMTGISVYILRGWLG